MSGDRKDSFSDSLEKVEEVQLEKLDVQELEKDGGAKVKAAGNGTC